MPIGCRFALRVYFLSPRPPPPPPPAAPGGGYGWAVFSGCLFLKEILIIFFVFLAL
jgi:hypothetical protein